MTEERKKLYIEIGVGSALAVLLFYILHHMVNAKPAPAPPPDQSVGQYLAQDLAGFDLNNVDGVAAAAAASATEPTVVGVAQSTYNAVVAQVGELQKQLTTAQQKIAAAAKAAVTPTK